MWFNWRESKSHFEALSWSRHCGLSVIILNWALCSANIIVLCYHYCCRCARRINFQLTLPAASIAVAADGSKKLKYKMYIMQRCVGWHYAVADIAKLCGSRPPTGQPVLKIPRMESFFSVQERWDSRFFGTWSYQHCLNDIVGDVCVVAVVVYNIVVISGEDFGGQMREMAIFGVPLVRSHGVPGCPRV